MKRVVLIAVALATALSANAGFELERTVEIPLGNLSGKGQISNPRFSPDGKAFFFEFLAPDADMAEVYVVEVEKPGSFPPVTRAPEPAVPAKKMDIFSLGGATASRSVSEHPAWGPSSERGQTLAFAATRKEGGQAGVRVNFDIFYKAPGKKRFLTDHPENDSEPVFSPGGEYLVFASGRTGEGDLYLYSFYASGDPTFRITFEESGSELYPAWSPDGKALAFIGHLGGADHLLIIDDIPALLAKKDEAGRKTLARSFTRDLTAGWRHSALGPSFSPDGKWIAFFMHPKGETRTDLYVITRQGGEPVLLRENVLSPSRGGPAWSPDGKGVFVAEENAREMNPLWWIPVDAGARPKKLATGTQLNMDPSIYTEGNQSILLYAAQGGGEKDTEKRWRRIFASRLIGK